MAKADLTPERLREVLDYDPGTGEFTNRITRTRAIAGAIAGNVNQIGYRQIWLNARPHLAHRLAWLYVYGEWPSGEVDHINGIRHDNRIQNLRVVSTSVNMQNLKGPTARNKSGFLGVSRVRKTGRWGAFIKCGSKNTNLGTYNTPEEAHQAYLAAKRRLHEGCTI